MLVVKRSLITQGKRMSSLDMCLTSRSLVSTLVIFFFFFFFFLGLEPSVSNQGGGFARLKTSVSNRSWKQTVLTNKRGTNLDTKLLKVRHMSKVEFLLPWLTNLCFKTNIFERVWPPFHLVSKFCMLLTQYLVIFFYGNSFPR